ncbi:MAG: transglutaminase domain-containing protein [Desulfobacterales bacterium]|uniref:Transglutaminase domain-containing protein n=1 Tax=Candidatus Desulfatibia vada TaxID=2841696 RepID=A0A8J6NZN6_9BACT|nr:transglutaminase domain-containing protein [Candidatus Desulfatibia vada]MBL6972530.1 transglutaminase domain-containing protein [Desulfobacterales bacterium]
MSKYLYLIAVITFLILPSNVWAKTASGKIIMEFDLSAHDHDKEARLWIPYPITNKNQTITNIHVEGNYSSSGVYTDSTFQTPMLYARWDSGIKNRTLTFSFDVKRQGIVSRPFPEKETAWDPADYALYLAPTRLGPIDGEVKKLAEKIAAGQTTVLGKAKAIYDWTCENTYRNPETRGCGIGDVYKLLKEPGGKCADISSIYVALARAAGVPSREVFGIRQGKKAVEDISKWQHCWAEFYLPGYGWVPVDPADVRKMMLKQNFTLSDAKTTEYRKYFWGGIDPYRIKLGEGRDLILNPPRSGPPVNYLMYPFAQVGKKTLDWLEPETFKYKITYKQK